MYGWVCVAWRCHKVACLVVRAPLLLCRQATASWCTRISPSHSSCLLHSTGHCSSANNGVALSGVILMPGWTTAGMPSFGLI